MSGQPGSKSERDKSSRGTLAASIREYREIAAVLSRRAGLTISEAEVKQLCESAESKVIRAVRSDAALRKAIENRRTEENRGMSVGSQSDEPWTCSSGITDLLLDWNES